MPSNMRLCEVCGVKFAGNHFIDSSECRYCTLQSLGTEIVARLEKLETEKAELLQKAKTEYTERLRVETEHAELLRKLEAEQAERLKMETEYTERLGKVENSLKEMTDKFERKIKDSENKIAVLEEFIASNVGCASGAVVTDAAAAETSLEQPTTMVETQSRSAPEEAPFIPVRNGARPSHTRNFLPVKTSNRFHLFASEEDESSEVRIVGDSIVREQLSEFCGRAQKTRKRFCMPGGRLDDITAACEEASRECNENTLFILHAGTNDIELTRSEELMEKYKEMIQCFKTKSRNIIVSGILPRRRAPREFYDRAFSTNNRLKTLCAEEGIDYVNFWNDFYDLNGKRQLFSEDGLHLSPVGSARLGRLLNEAVIRYRKNLQQPRTESPT